MEGIKPEIAEEFDFQITVNTTSVFLHFQSLMNLMKGQNCDLLRT